MVRPSVVAIVICTGSATPCLRPASSTNPTIFATADTGSSSSPNVRAR